MARRPFIAVLLVGSAAYFFGGLPACGDTQTEAEAGFDFYIAVDGNDAWSGRLAKPNAARSDGPFASLARAQMAVREIRKGDPSAKTNVALRDGTHRLRETIVFSLEDSSDAGSATYAAYPGETPVLSSGVPLTGWMRVVDAPKQAAAKSEDRLWSVDVPSELGNVLTLYDGLQRLSRARGRGFTPPHSWSDDGAGRAPCDLFYFPSGVAAGYSDFQGAELLVMPSANYEMNILPVSFVDKERDLGVTAFPASRPMGSMQFHPETMWIENRLEDLDEPGEWVYDDDSRRIYLWPAKDSPGDGIVAPLLTELVRIEGAIHYAAPADEPTRNLKFRGLTFAHAERLPRHGQDGWDLQHSWEQFDSPTALLRLRGAENCNVEACRFIAGGGAGVRLDLHCQGNAIRGCEFARLGGVGVLLAGYGPGTKDVNKDNDVTNNWIHHIGELYWASPAIFVWQSGRNAIANNLIHNTPYTGIVVSGRISLNRAGTSGSVRTVRWNEIRQKDKAPWTWAIREPYLHGRLNQVVRNDIHHVMERLGDGNGIYISGTGKENLIKENVIHDVDSDHLVQAIRCDDDQEETVIEKNLIFKVRSMHQAIAIKGKNDVINNIMVGLIPSRLDINPKWQLHGYIGLNVNPVNGARVQRNVIYSTDAGYTPFNQHRLYGQGAEPRLRDCAADNNLYFCPDDPDWGEKHLKVERDFGIEAHSISADPLFVDMNNGDFRFQEHSPAIALGIEPIDASAAGLLPDHPYWPRN